MSTALRFESLLAGGYPHIACVIHVIRSDPWESNSTTLPETNIALENQWLEDEIPFGSPWGPYFQGLCLFQGVYYLSCLEPELDVLKVWQEKPFLRSQCLEKPKAPHEAFPSGTSGEKAFTYPLRIHWDERHFYLHEWLVFMVRCR